MTVTLLPNKVQNKTKQNLPKKANPPQPHAVKTKKSHGDGGIIHTGSSSSTCSVALRGSSERAAAAEEEAAHHGDERDGLHGRDDAPERGVHQERHVPHELGPPPRRRAELLIGARPLPLPPLLDLDPEVRGRRGEQRGQAGQAQVRRPPEHGHQPSPHGPAEARPRGDGGLHARRLVPHFPSSLPLDPGAGAGRALRRPSVVRSLWRSGSSV